MTIGQLRPDPRLTAAIDLLKEPLDSLVRRSKTPGLQYVVADASSILFEHHAGAADIAGQRPMLAETRMMAYSMSKTITAAAVLQLVESNRLGLDDQISRYIEWQPYGSAITVRQLLSHTAGIPNPIPLRWVHAAAAHETFNEEEALRRVLQKHRRLAFRPGTKYAYSNIGYWLLGPIVEQVSGEAFASYVTNHVLRPLGLTPDEIGYAIPESAAHAAGYLEKFSLINLIKPWFIDRDLIGAYEGRWLRIREHYLNGPAFGGLVGTAAGFGKFLQDQLREHSRLFGDGTRALLVEQQHIAKGAISMTLGWHMGTTGGVRYLFKEGGGGGFHCMMRLYPAGNIGTVLMTNATGIDVSGALNLVDPIALRTIHS